MVWGRRIWYFISDLFFIALILAIPISYGCGYEEGYRKAKIKEDHLYRLLKDIEEDG